MRTKRSLFVVLAILLGMVGSLFGLQFASAHTGHSISIQAAVSHPEGTASTTPPTGSEDSPNTVTANASITVTVSPAPALGEAILVDYATNSGATPTADGDTGTMHYNDCKSTPSDHGCDYTHESGTLTFDDPTSTTQTITIPVLQDRTDELDEKFNVALFNPRTTCSIPCTSSSASISNANSVVTIVDNDAAPAIAVQDRSAAEPASAGGTSTLNAVIRRLGASERDVAVTYATQNNSAVAPADYDSVSDTRAFPNSNENADITVPITVKGDDISEGSETFFLNASNPVNATISDAQGVQTITDNDASVISVNDVSATEGSPLNFVISVTVPPDALGETVTVSYTTEPATNHGSATPNTDYTPQSGTVTFNPGQTSSTVAVPTLVDAVDENNETVTLRISNIVATGGYQVQFPNGAAFDDGTGVIRDDDGNGAHDFNGDGFSDAAFGVPGEDAGTKSNTGAVNVIYGESGGLSPNTPNDQVWDMAGTGLGGNAENDKFGSSLAFGNFNGDNFDDILIGVPGRSSGAGAAVMLLGSANGLTATNAKLLSQGGAFGETAEPGDRFGTSVAGGDINGDGFDDALIGVPDEAVGTAALAGAVHVLRGTGGAAGGLGSANSQVWTQDTSTVLDTAEAGDRFGFSVSLGDLNGDGRADALIGVPHEDVDAIVNAGAANVLYADSNGLTATGNQFWTQGTSGDSVEDASETGDSFGWATTIGDLDGDGFGDAAIGVPLEDVTVGTPPNTTTVIDAGAVNVLYGSTSTGLVTGRNKFLSQATTDLEGSPEEDDLFGYALSTGDFNNDSRSDLVIGVPFEDVGSKADAGTAHVLVGAATTGVNSPGTTDRLWDQNQPGIGGSAERGDQFAYAVATGDYNGDGEADLVVGVRGEDFSTAKRNAGMAHVIFGTTSGLNAAGDEVWHQDSANVGGGAERSDVFGSAVL